MASKETILTADGLKKLQEELAQRKGEIREEIVERLKEARAQGAMSERSRQAAPFGLYPENIMTFRKRYFQKNSICRRSG